MGLELVEAEDLKPRVIDGIEVDPGAVTMPDGRWIIPCPKHKPKTNSIYPDRSQPCETCGSLNRYGGQIAVDPIEPIKPCKVEDHKWEMEIEEGRVHLICKDPHSDLEQEAMRHYRGKGERDFLKYSEYNAYAPWCAMNEWIENDYYMSPEPIPVKLHWYYSSGSSGPWGESEPEAWMEISPA
jgi:hypothetical protein